MMAIVLTAICLLPATIRMINYPGYPGADDAFIHLAIVENIYRGLGWGINAHDRVFLSTSPLFTVLMTAVRFVTPRILEMGMGLSVMSGVLYVLGVFVLGRRLSQGDRLWGLISAVLAATNIHFWRWNGTFMETTFAMAASVWMINAYLRAHDSSRNRWFFLLGLLLAASVLLRPELGLLGVAFLAHSLVNGRRQILRRYAAMAAGLACFLVPVLVVLYLYFGTILPSTFTAKTTAGLVWLNFPVWGQLFKAMVSGCLGALIVLGIGAVKGVRCAECTRIFPPLLSSVVVWILPVLGFCFYSLKMPGLQSAARYYLPFMAVISALPAVLAGPGSWLREQRAVAVVSVICILQAGFSGVLNEIRIKPVLSGMWGGYVATMREAAREIDTRSALHRPTLICVDIGVVAATRSPDITLLDGGGLASPALCGLSLPEMIRVGRPQFVLESLGSEHHEVERTLYASGIMFSNVWSRRFASHSIEHGHSTYEARLFELKGLP